MNCPQCEKLKEALLDMCIQFSSSSDDRLQHSFMSAEEYAFDLLGLENGMTFEEAERKVLAAPSPLTSVLPSDDDEPITREWAIEEFGSIRWGSESYAVVINDAMTVWLTPTQDVVLVVGDGAGPPWDEPLRHIRTRGDLRRLLAALGYRREG